MEEQMKYYAFISYNSADEKWAKWLQHNLEYYHVPSALCKEYPDLPKKIRPVFWYKQDLSGTKLKEALSKELESSKYLIVVCSPESAKSVWVNDEVLSFLEQGKGDKIIPFIVGGTPHAQNPNEECFPPALLTLKREEEIRGIDVRRKEGKQHALVDVIATMFGIRFDELWQRHKKSQRRKIIISLLFLLAIISICIAWRYSVKKELITQAKFIAAEAEKLAENGDVYLAAKLLMYIERNNKESFRTVRFEHAVRCLDYVYKFPEKIYVHSDGVRSAEFSPDGKYLVTSWDNTSIYSVESGECIHIMSHSEPIRYSSFSPDGKYIFTESYDKSIKIWSVETGLCVHTLSVSCEELSSPLLSPDGRNLITKSYESSDCFNGESHDCVRLWSVETGECLMILQHDDDINLYKFTPDGKYILTGSLRDVRLWSVETRECIMIYDIGCVIHEFSPDGKYILISSGGNIELWSVETGDCSNTIKQNVLDARFTQDGKCIVAESYDGSIKIWSVETGECLFNFEESDIRLRFDMFSPDGKYFITQSDDNILKLWSIENGNCLYIMKHESFVKSVSFSPDGNYILTASDDNTARLWLLNDVNDMCKEYEGDVYTFSSDGKYLITALDNSELLQLYLMETGECVVDIEKDNYDFEFSMDGKYIVSYNWYGDELKLLSVETGKCLVNMEHSYVEEVSFSPNGRYLATASSDKIKLWSISTGKCMSTIMTPSDDMVHSVYFDKCGENMIVIRGSEHDAMVELRSVETGEIKYTIGYGEYISYHYEEEKYIIESTGGIWSLETGEYMDTLNCFGCAEYARFSHNNKYVITSSDYGGLKLWSLETGNCLYTLSYNEGSFETCFSSDDMYLLTIIDDKIVKLWSVETGECIMTIRHEDDVEYASFVHDDKYIITVSGNVIRKYKLTPLSEILSRWSEILGPNAELTEEEKARYFLN